MSLHGALPMCLVCIPRGQFVQRGVASCFQRACTHSPRCEKAQWGCCCKSKGCQKHRASYPVASPSIDTGPTAARINSSVGNPTAAVMRLTWRLRPSRISSSSHDVGCACRTRSHIDIGDVSEVLQPAPTPFGCELAEDAVGFVEADQVKVGSKPIHDFLEMKLLHQAFQMGLIQHERTLQSTAAWLVSRLPPLLLR